MLNKGFTLIEILIVIFILGILSIVILTALNPIELINRGKDTSTLETATQVQDASHRYIAANFKTPWNEDVEAVNLVSTEGQTVLEELIDLGEVKESFKKNKNLSNLYLSATKDMRLIFICFEPRSQAFKNKKETVYVRGGQLAENCDEEDCFYCITDSGYRGLADIGKNDDHSTGQSTKDENENQGGDDQEEDEQEVTDDCSPFNPEYPQYPWTCNYTSMYPQYNCTNFCVSDLGCDNYCPAGQRHLKKSFYGPAADNTCFSKWKEISEDYCVSGEAAGCSVMLYQSSPNDFNWGCTNPRRPYQWKVSH